MGQIINWRIGLSNSWSFLRDTLPDLSTSSIDEVYKFIIIWYGALEHYHHLRLCPVLSLNE